MCGIPCSGKTTRATELASLLEKYISDHAPTLSEKKISIRPNVVILNDESLKIDKTSAYSDPTSEKNARASLLSAVERHLSRETLLICDSTNYIKGFRYQLYCIARALGTPHCVIYCGSTPTQSLQFHSSISDSQKTYPLDTLQALTSRFEEPDSRNRWDSPLFIFSPSDDSASEIENIAQALIYKKPPQPNLSTVVKPLTETNYLHSMDRATQEIVDAVLQAQQDGKGGGESIVVPRSEVKVVLPGRTVTMSEMRRLRRQFTNLNKMHTELDLEKLAGGFVEYVNANF
ncbi:kti12, chromatin associated [Rhizophlyctis rosea]|uniref:Kti12, chromatin associated n=1 Tax=Rhizophlyctis rosea TaxID=64517 RepID=A0AAD5S413_9FUNG|nr:kti12, chromatin associated [Rhizophlyctis rosea]